MNKIETHLLDRKIIEKMEHFGRLNELSEISTSEQASS